MQGAGLEITYEDLTAQKGKTNKETLSTACCGIMLCLNVLHQNNRTPFEHAVSLLNGTGDNDAKHSTDCGMAY